VNYTDLLLEEPEVETIITNIGRRGRSTLTNAGTLSITLVDESRRDEATADVAVRLHLLDDDDDINIEIANLGGSGGIPWAEDGQAGEFGSA
jgi:hydrophobic/amphiphilic exporter-1 (mainly G- bacteria), HAE1 family